VGRPEGCVPLEDLHPTVRPPLSESSASLPALTQIADYLSWRSGHHNATRWPIQELEDDSVTLLAPRMVNDSVLTVHGDRRDDLRTVTVAEATHPRQGPGILIQVALPASIRDTAAAYRHFGVVTGGGRWYGTGLGAFMLWTSEEHTELVYRAFLPCRLLGALSELDALDLVGDTALGAVNITGVAEATIEALASTSDVDELPAALDVVNSETRKRYRVAALRAATRVRPRPDGLVDTDGPLVDVGAAVLDRLAFDQLQITTAPFLIWERSFAWLPGPHPQIVSATQMRPSRGHEITEVVLTTEIGTVNGDQIRPAVEVCLELMTDLPLCSAIVDDEGRVVLSSRVILHEGVWWHRAEMVNVLAAMQLNLAEGAAATFDLRGVKLGQDSPLLASLSEDGVSDQYDSIYDVVPHLRTLIQRYPVDMKDVVELASTKLLEMPFSRLFGELDEDPDVVVLAQDLHDDGGWDPPIGEALVTFESLDHPIAGPSLKVGVNPGYLPGGSDLVAETKRLVQFTHSVGGLALCPSWEISGPTIKTTLVVPRMAVSVSDLDSWVEWTLQAVNSSIHALARVVTTSPRVFPDFDRSQINLTRTDPSYPEPAADSQTIVWAPLVNRRAIGFPVKNEGVERWHKVVLHHEDAGRLAAWLTADDPDTMFEHPAIEVDRSGPFRVLRVDDLVFRFDEASARALSAQLRQPEAPATGRLPGRIVTCALEAWIDEDGDLVLLLPPAPAIIPIFQAEDISCLGVSAITSNSFFLRFTAAGKSLDLEVPVELGEQLLASADGNGLVTFVVLFPAIDRRLGPEPPDPWVGQLPATAIAITLDELQAFGSN